MAPGDDAEKRASVVTSFTIGGVNVAVEAADLVIVTDDNPRTEVPAEIRAEILAAAPGAREVGDRRAAIAGAIALAREGDVVLVAGKGHEQGQVIGTDVLPFDDAEVAREEAGR